MIPSRHVRPCGQETVDAGVADHVWVEIVRFYSRYHTTDVAWIHAWAHDIRIPVDKMVPGQQASACIACIMPWHDSIYCSSANILLHIFPTHIIDDYSSLHLLTTSYFHAIFI